MFLETLTFTSTRPTPTDTHPLRHLIHQSPPLSPISSSLLPRYPPAQYKTTDGAPGIGAGISKQDYDKYDENNRWRRMTIQICVHLRSSAVNISRYLLNTSRSLRCMMFLTAKGAKDAKISSVCLHNEFSKKNRSKSTTNLYELDANPRSWSSFAFVSVRCFFNLFCKFNNYVHQS